MGENAKIWQRKYNDFYFLTRPELFIVDHLPTKPAEGSGIAAGRLALLPLGKALPTLQEFATNVADRATHRWLPVSHPQSQVALPTGVRHLRLAFDLFPSDSRYFEVVGSLSGPGSGGSVTSTISHDHNHLVMEAQLPPAAGRYTLSLEFKYYEPRKEGSRTYYWWTPSHAAYTITAS